MKLRNLKIKTQLYLGLGIILCFVLILGALAWHQTLLLWEDTRQLYNHPLAVRRAIGELKADILVIQRSMKEILLTNDEREKETILQNVDVQEAKARRQIEILYDRYLGPKKDIDLTYQIFIQWETFRDESIRLLKTGKTAEAAIRLKSSGIAGQQVEKLVAQIQKISDFALNKADQFYLAARERKDTLSLQLGLVMGVILLLALGLSFFLIRAIKEPLKELTEVTDRFRQGNLEVRSGYVSSNEFGTLAGAFNALAGSIESEISFKEQATHLRTIMLQDLESGALGQQLLETLMRYTGSQIGAIYLLNEAKSDYELFESIGLGKASRTSFSATAREGEFGVALTSREIQHIRQIPPDTPFIFATAGGDFKPREILTIPLLLGPEIPAIISLASLREYDSSAVRLATEMKSALATWMNSLLANRRIQILTQGLEEQNLELEVQKNELYAQANELTQQNTELEMQKRQLDEANRLKTAFLSNMSHELRTPLNSVIALAGVLNRRLAKKINDVEYGYLEIIERNGKNLLSLINDILDLSRIEAGKEELGLSRFPVRTLINETVSILQPLADEKGLVLRQEVPGDLPLMNSDFDKCRHILQNLLANAVKFTDQGEVTITAEYEPGSIRNTKSEIRISVADSGIGIPADQVPLIFQEFRQVDDGISRKYGGTGLGLAIAQKYAALLQGRIEVESTLGQGSTFTLILPLKLERRARITFNQEPEPLSGRSKEAAQAKVAPFQGLSILLVEDNEAAVIQMTDILSDQGYDLRVARNGKEALEQIETALPSAMILDLMMPEVDGFQVLAAIRKKEKTAHIPVLILTAKHITPEELTFLKGNHIYQLIQKGDINRAELLKAVAEMITPSPKESKEDPRELKQVLRSGKPVILVVEDNADNMKTVLALLGDKGIILEAYDGPEALDLAQKHRPDLILLDIALPRMDGFTVLERIREDETLKHIPVIALTASAMKGDREEILARGFDGYLSKPLDLEYFEEMLQEVIYADQLS